MKMTRKITKTAARYWTEDEDNCLIKYYPLSSWDEILNMLPNRSRTAITARASHLGLKKDSYFWPKADIDILVNNYGKCSIEELCDRVIWLEHGKVVEIGNTKEVCKHYYDAQMSN